MVTIHRIAIMILSTAGATFRLTASYRSLISKCQKFRGSSLLNWIFVNPDWLAIRMFHTTLALKRLRRQTYLVYIDQRIFFSESQLQLLELHHLSILFELNIKWYFLLIRIRAENHNSFSRAIQRIINHLLIDHQILAPPTAFRSCKIRDVLCLS